MKRSTLILLCSLLYGLLLPLPGASTSAAPTPLAGEAVAFSLPDGWTLGEVAAIERRDNGHFILFHRGAHQLLEFDSKRRFVREIGPGLFRNPHGLRIDAQGNIWTTDSGTHVVLRFSPVGTLTMVLGKNNLAGTGWFDRDYHLVLFDQPLDVAQDRHGNIYVVDKGNNRIVKMDPNGFLLKAWGAPGSGPGEFNFAHSIVVDGNDRVYVADRENKRIQRFDLDGTFIDQWTDVGYPYVMTLTSESLWVTHARAEIVRQFDLNGRELNRFQGDAGRNPGQFSSVHGIHTDADGTVWVTQVFNWGGVNRLQPRR
jgi:DNA-binding beta-propeller fold protein YncE